MGLIIGLNTKVFSSLTIFLFIFLGSLIGKGQGQVLSILIFFIIGILIVKTLKKRISKKNKIISILF